MKNSPCMKFCCVIPLKFMPHKSTISEPIVLAIWSWSSKKGTEAKHQNIIGLADFWIISSWSRYPVSLCNDEDVFEPNAFSKTFSNLLIPCGTSDKKSLWNEPRDGFDLTIPTKIFSSSMVFVVWWWKLFASCSSTYSAVSSPVRHV